MDRREFVKQVGAAALGTALGSEVGYAADGEKGKGPQKFERYETGIDLNELHGRVANAFNEEVGKTLKEKQSLKARNFRMRLFRNSDDTYTIFLNLDFVPIQDNEKPDTIFEARSTVWAGVDAQEKVLKNYQETIQPWEARMRAAFPDTTFIVEISHGGDSTLAHYECMMAGG